MKLRTRFFLYIFACCLLAILTVAGISYLNFKQSLLGYLSERQARMVAPVQEALAEEMNRNNISLEQITTRQWLHILRENMPRRHGLPSDALPPNALPPYRGRFPSRNSWPREEPSPFHESEYHESGHDEDEHGEPSDNADRYRAHPLPVLYNLSREPIAGPDIPWKNALTYPLFQNDRQIGWIGFPRFRQLTEKADIRFLKTQRHFLLQASLIAALFSFLAAFLLARHFLKPIGTLNRAIHQLARGDYELALTPLGQDELAALLADCNHLACTLSESRKAQQRWLSDIAHELRTPLTVLTGELEALADGIRPLSTDTLVSLKEEVAHLMTLVNDLHQLALADSGGLQYHMAPTDLEALLGQQESRYQSLAAQHQLTLQMELARQAVIILGDRTRLLQLIDNLVANSCRYTHPGGRIIIRLSQSTDEAILTVDDSPPGIPDSALPKLFDRLFRVEESRNRQTGGHGLGLSLCKQVAEAHQGTIRAEHSPLGGLRIIVTLPLANASRKT